MVKINSQVRFGSATVDESRCIAELAELQTEITAWAGGHELWHDAWFKTPFIHKGDAPERYSALLLVFEGPLFDIFNYARTDADELYEEFRALLKNRGFEFELENHYTMEIRPSDEKRADEYLALYRWQWIQHLATQRLFDVHSEVFEHFAKNPDHLARLEWRQYEEFLDSVFRNQGFRTELGPGTNDGGIDIRLYQSQSLPQMVTVVQAKKYRARPINLDTVAALFGNAVLHKAHTGILATTSRFQPAAKKFAHSIPSGVGFPNIDLVDSRRVGGWCADIAKELNSYFQNGETPAPPVITSEHTGGLTGRIVVAHGGHNMVINYFARIVADFPHEVVLESLTSESSSSDGQQGTEVANINSAPGLRFTAFKRVWEDGRVNFWGTGKLYSFWDGTPQGFDYCD